MSISPSTTFLPLPSPGLYSYDKQPFQDSAFPQCMHSPSSPGAISGFVAKLWSLLETDEQWGQYIRWTETGEAFAIVDIETFAQNVLPQAFKHDKFPSFVRQLNIYGFNRVKVDPRKAKDGKSRWTTSFIHPVFKRDHPEWLNQIKRKPPRSARAGEKLAARNFSLTHPSGLMSEGALDPELLDTLSPLTPDEPFFSSMYEGSSGQGHSHSLHENLDSMDYLSPLASPRIGGIEFSGSQSSPTSWHGQGQPQGQPQGQRQNDKDTSSVPHSDSTYGSISPMPTVMALTAQSSVYQPRIVSDQPILTAPSIPSSALDEKMTRLIQQNENLRQDVLRLTNILSTAVFPEMSRIVAEQQNQANMQRNQQLMLEHFHRQLSQSSSQKTSPEESSEHQ